MSRPTSESRRPTPRSPPPASASWLSGTVRRRILAYVADAVVFCAAVFAAVTALTRSRLRRIALGGLFGVVGAFLYHIVFEGTWGQTPGKKVFGIVVERTNGEPCTYTAATVRTVFRLVDALPIAYLAAFVSIRLTERQQRLGDFAAGTVVSETDDRRERKEN